MTPPIVDPSIESSYNDQWRHEGPPFCTHARCTGRTSAQCEVRVLKSRCSRRDNRDEAAMTSSEPLTKEYVAEIFKCLEGDGMAHAAFAKHLAEDLSWTIKGKHPLAGHYQSRQAFQVQLRTLSDPLCLRSSALAQGACPTYKSVVEIQRQSSPQEAHLRPESGTPAAAYTVVHSSSQALHSWLCRMELSNGYQPAYRTP